MCFRMTVSIGLLLILGSASTAVAIGDESSWRRHPRSQVDHQVTTPSHLPNHGFGCDPDFGPNGYNPCVEAR
jgi:hypothetical protein